jgi:hypothetical protein
MSGRRRGAGAIVMAAVAAAVRIATHDPADSSQTLPSMGQESRTGRTRLSVELVLPRPTLPRVSWDWEENSPYLYVCVYNRNAPGLDDQLAWLDVRVEMSDRLGEVMDWLLPDRRGWVDGKPFAGKGWCARRG